AIALVVGVRETLEVSEEIVAQIEFDVAGNADYDPAREELEDAFGEKDADDSQGIFQQFVRGDSGMEIVGGVAQDLRKLDRDSVSEQNAQSAPGETRPIALQIGN